jgi:uncharacterized membrane protein (DUF106 family)
VKFLNGTLSRLFDLLFLPFRGVDPMWALLAISVLTGVLMLWLFGKVSDQDTIRAVRDRIRGNLIAVRLFGDDIALLAKLQGRILGQTVVYLRYAFVPMLIMIVPVVLILTQLNLWFASRPLETGDDAVLTVQLRDPAATTGEVALESPNGISVETPPVRATAVGQVSWRIRGQEPGRHRVEIRVGEEVVEKEVRVGTDWGATSSRRTGSGFWDILLYPGEDPIDRSSVVERVDVGYVPLELSAFGFGIDWLIFFFVVSIAAGFALRKPLGVEI